MKRWSPPVGVTSGEQVVSAQVEPVVEGCGAVEAAVDATEPDSPEDRVCVSSQCIVERRVANSHPRRSGGWSPG
jgi:hypothetical protein